PADPEIPDEHELRMAMLELPDAPPLRWSTASAESPRGRVEMERFGSQRLADERRVYTYLPASYEPDAGPYPLLIVFDGWAFTQLVQAQVTLDNLIHRGAIPPLVAVMPDSGDTPARMRDLGMSDDHNAYVTDELLPWARERWNLSTSPSQVISAGSSLGGVAATYLAMQRPDVTASVLSLSGAFQYAPEDGSKPTMWIAHELARRDPLPIRFWLNAGTLENISDHAWPSIRAANRHLHDVLVAKEYRVDYSEYPGAHDYFWWVETLADGLIALLRQT
ncbi:MAG TPA: alpha/beta hydrolase-fold protein, partial [Gemmatimonadales bacterium]|nr:alpha/beta hydrolase-fold protein [Gemmatimonadales bacterium]